MYNIYESFDNEGERGVYGTPDNWEIDGELLWPPSGCRNINLFRKNKQTPGEDWQKIASFKLLAKGIPTFRAMLSKERMYEQHSDSESAAEAKKRKAQKRSHPVNSKTESVGLPDLNSDFESISAQPGTQAKSNNTPIEAAAVAMATYPQDPNLLSNFDDRNMLLSSSVVEARNFRKDVPTKFHTSKHGGALIPKQTVSSSLENPMGTNVKSMNDSSKKAKILSVDIVNNGCDSQEYHTNDIPLSAALNIMNLPIDYLNDLPTLTDADLSELYPPAVGSTIAIDLSELRQNLQPPLNQNVWTNYERKLSDVEKRLELAETQLNRIEANQGGLKAHNENLLKLVAALHVKIDGSINQAIPQPTRKKDIPADVQKLVDELPVKNKPHFGEFLKAYKNKIDLKDALFDELKLIGGADEEKCTKRILAALFSDDLLMDYTWFGTSTKDPFKDYKVHALIKECVRVHYATLTDANYQSYVQDHLKYACSRVERRYLQ